MNSSEYQVTIKSANQKVDDYVTKCRPGWTVHQLKQHISETHVNKPKVEDQRLIYAGNLLKDTHTLKQIFFRNSLCTELTNSSKTDFTIHLVCYSYTYRLPGNPSLGTGQALTAGQSSSTTSASSTAATNSTQTGFIRSMPNTAIANRSPVNNQPAPVTRNTPLSPISNQNPLPATSSTTLNATQQAEMIRNFMQSDQMRQQMVVFQQLAHMVAAQIATNLAYSNYNNIINSNQRNSTTNETLSSHAHLPVIGDQLANSPITSAASQLLYAEDRQRAQFVQSSTQEHRAGAVNQNENINNENNANAPAVVEPARAQFGFGGPLQGPAPVVEHPAPQPIVEHDVIDWVYYSIRAVGLMVALYIHASMFRLLFILGILAIAFFFNRRRVAPAARHDLGQPQRAQVLHPFVNQRAHQENAELRRGVADRGEQPNVANRVAIVNNDEEAAARGRAQEEVGPGRVPFLKLCYLVVTDFLASLVPE